MKKMFCLLFLLALVLPATAQRSRSAGIRAGVNFSNITNTVFSARTAWYAGMVGEMRVSDLYALQLEAGYSQQGASGDITDNKSYKRSFSAGEIRTEYFTGGVMNKFTFQRMFSFMVGLSGEQELSRNPFISKTLDMALVTGAEFKFTPVVGLEVRAKRGLTDIFENSAYTIKDYTGSLIGTNANLVFQAGLVFHFKDKDK